MRDEGRFQNLLATEHDSCGIICIVEKDGFPSRQNIQKTIDALVKMEHRSGFINGEGDGCGILTDIPRALWEKKLTEAGLDGKLAYDERFSVAHIFVPRKLDISVAEMQNGIRGLFGQFEVSVLLEQENQVDSSVLGPNGLNDEPTFWQIAGLCDKQGVKTADHLFELHVAIEAKYAVHVATLSNVTAAYKVMGAASILPKYYNDTRDPLFAAQVTIGHNRYSTNTQSSFFRVQPFSLLGHNGEINTVKKLRIEADMVGVPLVDGGSDSQDMNRTIETFIHRSGVSLFEAMEIVFPPIHNEMKLFRPEMQDLYVYYRQAWGHYAQGPAGIVSRYGNECIFSVDALGLRPVWMVESESSLYFSSEQGVITVGDMVAEPKPIAPGEKIGVILTPGEHVQVIPYYEVQSLVLERAKARIGFEGLRKHLYNEVPATEVEASADIVPSDSLYSAYGWDRDGIQMIETTAETGAEPIRSLGHDSPHAALAWERVNIPDYIKESVAVVTNPAIDRDREMEHFSTRVVVGPRPKVYGQPDHRLRLELLYPVVLEGSNGADSLSELKQPSYEQLKAMFGDSVATLSTTFARGTSLQAALDQLATDAIEAVRQGAALLILDDAGSHQNDRLWIEPHLAVSKVDIALRGEKLGYGDNLRRQTTLVLRSAAIRSLHDIAVACGLGADVLSPYLMFATAAAKDGAPAARKVFIALMKGLEKVISTIGTHELRGYTRFFSSIGLKPEVAEVLDIVNYLGSEKAGTGFAELEAQAEARYNDFSNPKAKAAKNFRFFQRMWKALGDAASGVAPYADYRDKLREEEKKNGISIRHVADFDIEKARAEGRKPLDPADVHIGIGGHDLPMLISSMSFGSQNETAFRAYAEAGERLNMVTMNGEGGEIKDMLGRYKRTRGAQVASGRFGVNVELATAVAFLEIKIGQGAKPGEGGHLPGSKVTAKIALARNATIGSDLISPSNNHDIYSIEDLAQIISELKEASGRQAKIIVKIPVVPGVGTIAVGVAKAGADVITLSGFDGGTGAARIHSITHVGLPTEIGTKLAHLALIEAGLRHQVELWSDGGMKSGADVVKMFMLGANRVGFGSIAMQSVGCTTCRGCHLDTCHVGIATQIDSLEEAEEKGLRRFVPRVYDTAVDSLVRLFGGIGQEIREIVAELGFKDAQELVGRSDLLKQVSHLERIDLSDLLRPAPLSFAAAQQMAREAEEQVAAATVVSSDIRIAAGAEGLDLFPESVSFDAPVERNWTNIDAESRILGSRYSSHRVRDRFDGSYDQLPKVSINITEGSVPGNGLAAFNARGVDITVHGGAEDGVGKMSLGGKVAILKAPGKHKQFINGSVGKSFGYGAQKGLFLIQGNADTRACIRFSGADVVFGGEITSPLQDELGGLAARANLKGFAFEYMTNGRAVVLGDPGPWICAGMTGGVIYQRLVPEMGLDEAALQRRIAKGAKVKVEPIGLQSAKDLTELLSAYHAELVNSGQENAAAGIQHLLNNLQTSFVRIAPVGLQADQSVATE
ncbi:glutamate synthase (NADPH/NADH) large chain [Paenibacillus sp. UNCCL117]|uniref:glutamate synthase-related protein n=1 Tax=unclassified Paenibacillus TaxID=185978 RepID=UPI00088BCD36|nr:MULTISPECIES: glutamate synthase-related protein [unclassified Paenibacillus]SDD89481.1 glutamate synthase (NADPH/NADH) large chain [Paenibacillus sp. cl123]SFW44161.1 glutamate synthase (NADPH/NADH) large chain [Paenibacillus sp. UNCCL117]